MAAERELTLSPGGAAPDLSSGSIFFIGTATVLLRYAGFTIPADPNFLFFAWLLRCIGTRTRGAHAQL